MNYEAKQAANSELLKSQSSQQFHAFSTKNSKSFKKNNKSNKSMKSKKQLLLQSKHSNDEYINEYGISFKKPSTTTNTTNNNTSSNKNQPNLEDNNSSFAERINKSSGLSRKDRAVSFRSTKVTLDQNYDSELDNNDQEFSFSTKLTQYTKKYNIFIILYERLNIFIYNFYKSIIRSNLIVWCKLQYSLFKHNLYLFYQKQLKKYNREVREFFLFGFIFFMIFTLYTIHCTIHYAIHYTIHHTILTRYYATHYTICYTLYYIL